MKKLLVLIAFMVLLTSCKKGYQFEVYAKAGTSKSVADKKISDDIIKEKNDSAAFVLAHTRFLILMNVRYSNMEKFRPEIHYFKLFNPKGEDISSGSFLQDPAKVIKANSDIWLSEDLRKYLLNLRRE